MGTNCNKRKHKEKLFLLFRPWHSLPREAAGPPPLAIPKPCGNVALGHRLWVTLLRAGGGGGWHRAIFWTPFPPPQPWVSTACATALTADPRRFT